jgi:hypothetical protein
VKHALHTLRNGVDWAGLAAGPAAWALSTQGNYSLASWVCHWRTNPVPVLGLVLVLIALVGAALSWRAWRSSNAGDEILLEQSGRPRAFLALMSALLAVLFALVIVMQASAGLILGGCER